jgi:radical SAM-linked protein
MSLPAALSVGYTGLNEVADVGLCHWVRPDEFCTRLQAELPEGVRILTARVTSPHPSRQPVELSYRVPLLAEHGLTPRRVDDLLARDEVTVIRRRKDESREIEIRPFIKALRFEDGAVLMLLGCSNRGTARPEEVMESLGAREGVDYLQSAIERTHVRLASSS